MASAHSSEAHPLPSRASTRATAAGGTRTGVRGILRPRRWQRYNNRTFYLFVSPWLIGFLVLTVGPLLYALAVSFTNFDGISGRWHWVGLSNYVTLFHDPDTWYSLIRTVLYTGISVPLSIAGGLGLALLLNQKIRAVGFFRAIFYLPSVVPIVATTVAWKLMFDRDAGPINGVIERIGGHGLTWLVDPYAFLVLIVLVLWGLGGGMVISLAGLQGVPSELTEAAQVDGANGWQAFRSVTLPLLTPVLFFQIVTGVIFSLQTLVQPLLLASGVVGTNLPVDVPRGNFLYLVNVYAQFFFNERYGYGSALLWVLFAILITLTLLIFRSSALWVYYEVED